MFQNFFKIAWRSLFKRKVYTLINILGLATGIAICMLIVLFIKSETGYDAFQQNADNIYRMVVERHYPGRNTSYAIIPQSYAAAVKQECPEVQESVRLYDFLGGTTFLVKIGDKLFEEKRVLTADSNFFRVFTGKMIAGSANNALNKPNAVVLNETTAKKYFGSADAALGKMIQPVGNNQDLLQVTAVCEDWPEQSHLNFDLLLTTSGNQFFTSENFVNFSAFTYLLLNKNASAKQLESKFQAVIEKYAKGNIEKQFAQSYKDFTAAGNGYTYYLQLLKDIHLTSHLEAEIQPNGSLRAVYIFTVVALFILLIACINFINLSTARSAERAKEVGIRKTFGSRRKSLVLQFLAESTMVSFVSMLLALAFAYLLVPLFNQISGKELSITTLFSVTNISLLLALTLFIGIIAGLYPAFVLSAFRPIVVLRGKFKSGGYGLALRNGLVVFQFAISVTLIICSIILNAQMKFMTSAELGFNKEHTIIVERSDLLADNTRAFKNELANIAGVETVTGASAFPAQTNFFGTSWQVAGSNNTITGRGLFTDELYASTLNLQLKQGRYFSKDFPSDSLAVILNEKAVQALELKNPIGARLTSADEFYNAADGTPYTYTVIGVVKDFYYQSMHDPVAPLVIVSSSRFKDVNGFTAVRIKADNFKATVASAENVWKQFVKDRPFHYEFLDKTVGQQYLAEDRMQRIITFFSSLAIFIACIGLLGLAAYATQQRTREISIRKVLGASAAGIAAMLSKDFVRLVVIAGLIAFPVAWFTMRSWLQDFTYRISIRWWMFALPAVIAVAIALLTVSYQAIRAAMANPVKSLRSE